MKRITTRCPVCGVETHTLQEKTVSTTYVEEVRVKVCKLCINKPEAKLLIALFET